MNHTAQLAASGAPRQPASPGTPLANQSPVLPAPKAPGDMIGDLDTPSGARWAIRAILASMAVLVAWAAVSNIDQVTHAPAQLIALARTQVVQSADGGVITQLHVKEGQRVRAGQLLATLQKARAKAAVDDSSAKVAALRITLTRLQAEVYGKPLSFDKTLLQYAEYIHNQTELYQKRQTALNDDLNALAGMLRLAESELGINRTLEASGDVSRADILRLERAVADLKSQAVSKRNKYFQEAQSEMTKAQEDLSTQSEALRDRSQVLDHTELLAPMDGIVNNIKLNTVGGVMRAGDTVMELVPTSEDLLAEAKVSPADIAFVAIDQDASVKLEAYDSSVFGAMRGKVSFISPDVITEETRQGTQTYYRVRIRITGKEFQGERADEIKLRPGLTAQVDIKARERTVLSYLVKPLTKTLGNALGER